VLQLERHQQHIHVAMSVKSNRQFTSNGCPADINRLLWEQYLVPQFEHNNILIDNPFHKERDYLCLVEAPIGESISTALHQLIHEAIHNEPITLHARVAVLADSNIKKKIYQSFFCPEDLAAEYHIRPEDTGLVLQRFLHQVFDFEKVASRDVTEAIIRCRTLLRDSDQQQAEQLFQRLCLLPRELAPYGGGKNRQHLIALLRDQFALAEAPVYHR
jgi:hypothetical protein